VAGEVPLLTNRPMAAVWVVACASQHGPPSRRTCVLQTEQASERRLGRRPLRMIFDRLVPARGRSRNAWECGRDQVAKAVAPFGFLDPEGRSTASSDWVRFGQERPGIQVLGQARQPAALRLEQQLEQRRKEQGMARDTRKPRLSRAFSYSGGPIRS
jgi:hypothetical protein